MTILEFIGTTLEFIGTVLIALTALSVHHTEITERGVDRRVLKIMKREQLFGYAGIAFVTTGFLLITLVFISGR